MANPARIPEPRSGDPLDPALDNRIDPITGEPRVAANQQQPRTVNNRVETRSGGSGMLIAAVVLVLAVIAYFVFVPASNDVTDVTVDTPAVTTDPAAPAPDATAPAAPADPTTPAPDATAPADPAAPAPDAAAPDATAPDATAPAEPAPAQ